MDRLYDLIRQQGFAPSRFVSTRVLSQAAEDFDMGVPAFAVDGIVTHALFDMPLLGGLLQEEGPVSTHSALPVMPEMFMEAQIPESFLPLFESSLVGVHILYVDLWEGLSAEQFASVNVNVSDQYLVTWLSQCLSMNPLSWTEQSLLRPASALRYRLEMIPMQASPVYPHTPKINPYRVVYFLTELGTLAFSESGRPLIFNVLIEDQGEVPDFVDAVTGVQEFNGRQTLPEISHYFYLALVYQNLKDTKIVRLVPNEQQAQDYLLQHGKEMGRLYYTLIKPSERTLAEIGAGIPPTGKTILNVPLNAFDN